MRKRTRPDASHAEVRAHHAAATGENPEHRVMAYALAAMTAGVPATRAWMWPVDSQGLMVGRVVTLSRGEQLDGLQQAVDEYFDRYAADDPMAPHRFADRRRLVVTADDVGGPEAIAAMRFGRGFLAESGFAHRVVIHVRHKGRIACVAALLRTAAEEPFSRSEVAFLQRIQPLVELAYTSVLRPPPALAQDDLLRAAGLSRREVQTARLAASGRTNAEIGHALMISTETVKRHLSTVYRKLGVRSRTELSVRIGSSEQGR